MTASVGSVFNAVLDPVNRHNPYPLYTSLRRTPVDRQPDGTYVVSTFREVADLLHDPRVSSQIDDGPDADAHAQIGLPPSFLRLDPPEHDRLRRLATRPFGPPHSPHRIDDLQPKLEDIVARLVRDLPGSTADLVDHFAYPLPVLVICSLLGVPVEDEPKFRGWIDTALQSIDPRRARQEQLDAAHAAFRDLAGYLGDLVDRRTAEPGDDLLSALATDDGPDGRMTREQLISTAVLLLIAGHETTVNLVANAALVLLRQPVWLDRFLADDGLVIPFVEEVLRWDPPVQLLPWRRALSDIPIAGTTIPQGASITLVLAAANRDPREIPDPDRFDPERRHIRHLGFGDGIHYCFGAPLARLEAQVALRGLAPVLAHARLLEDPPVYRMSAILRGPRHLRVALD
ncbi:cytochrome P450 [Dactylosporangium fulvum]|uniref:Cytochrome P450 n=1 Tax=Dactylosporangium fulvum TaxID=53359 RepID=A0ABY5VSN2_9ACTN|nr:cytochrome P450 [Dactylosporangium fulvum]UWP80738.1 cytochrome P450 [Dactylosporangium fulvum]